MPRKKRVVSQTQTQESMEMTQEDFEALLEVVDDLRKKVDSLSRQKSNATTFNSCVIDEGIDRLELFYRLLSATHQGFLANQYSDIINTNNDDAKILELEKIFRVTMLALRHYESLLVREVNAS